jgi:hypothetical protein
VATSGEFLVAAVKQLLARLVGGLERGMVRLLLPDSPGFLRSVFGSLAPVIVVIADLCISITAFLLGAQLDAIIRAQATGTLTGGAEVAGRREVGGARPASG